MKRIVAVVMCAICADALFAEDYGWASTTTDAGKWHTVASWTNSVGEAAETGTAEIFDTFGKPCGKATFGKGLVRLAVPPSGYAVLAGASARRTQSR